MLACPGASNWSRMRPKAPRIWALDASRPEPGLSSPAPRSFAPSTDLRREAWGRGQEVRG